MKSATYVLIETYWNVKLSTSRVITRQRSINRNILECKVMKRKDDGHFIDVLIETYWNVKKNIFSPNTQSLRINRNILECKVQRDRIRIMSVLVLIETYWNVKKFFGGFFSIRRHVLIETYWNVKDYSKSTGSTEDKY